MSDFTRHALTGRIIGAAIEVHRHIGPGLLESVYEQCLAYELTTRDIPFGRQLPVSITYGTHVLPSAFKADLVVGGEILLEIKAVEHLLPVHQAQVITYLRLLNLRRGLLINFNVPKLVDGVHSFLNG